MQQYVIRPTSPETVKFTLRIGAFLRLGDRSADAEEVPFALAQAPRVETQPSLQPRPKCGVRAPPEFAWHRSLAQATMPLQLDPHV